MEQKLVKVPFEVELAKKITNGEVDGRIVTRKGGSARVVCWDVNDRDDYVLALLSNDNREYPVNFLPNGRLVKYEEKQCDLMLEIPEYMTFKDGDILSYESGIFILKQFDGKDRVEYYVNLYAPYTAFDSACMMKNLVSHLRFATKEEKQKLINALKESKRTEAKQYLKRFFNIEVKSKCDFKVGQPVIGIDGRGEWRYDLFSHYKPEYRTGNYVCSARSYSTCLPYNDQTAHLIGTTKNWKE